LNELIDVDDDSNEQLDSRRERADSEFLAPHFTVNFKAHALGVS